ncbi:hypothetical protein [Leclercia adecarboxylata]|uniref:hypothetical protein n=1 Tax=Leclercia adecarboxylata TaxID=83655 RepID=UPI00124CED82|nr:hypothetical protein [Leclercia adecarboxylata]QFH50171.1 hypothetical protein FR819_13120 [Leclercia adecarboxylata]
MLNVAIHQGMNEAMQSNRLNARIVGRTWLTVSMVSVLLIGTSGSIMWWQGEQIRNPYPLISEMKRTEAMLSKKNNGVRLSLWGTVSAPA